MVKSGCYRWLEERCSKRYLDLCQLKRKIVLEADRVTECFYHFFLFFYIKLFILSDM